MRINQYLASATGISRRAADTAIAAGRVKLNDQIATLGQIVTPTDVVTLNNRVITPKTNHTYLLLNKPVGYVSSRTQQDASPTLYELIPSKFRALRIAGRLDLDSSGLILLSDDGAFIQNLTHPSHGKTKQYELTLSAPLTSNDLKKLGNGIPLRDGLSRVTILDTHGKNVLVTLEEGRNRQLRRTFGALGYHIERLHRTHIGPFELATLESGQWRILEPSEINL